MFNLFKGKPLSEWLIVTHLWAESDWFLKFLEPMTQCLWTCRRPRRLLCLPCAIASISVVLSVDAVVFFDFHILSLFEKGWFLRACSGSLKKLVEHDHPLMKVRQGMHSVDVRYVLAVRALSLSTEHAASSCKFDRQKSFSAKCLRHIQE